MTTAARSATFADEPAAASATSETERTAACRLAFLVHTPINRRDVEPELLAHLERVVAMVPRDAEAVAWLHEIDQDAGCPPLMLERAGIGTDAIDAVRLLTRARGTDDNESYLDYIAAIARAPGNAGRLARIVKVADINDRLHHPRPREDGWQPPYGEGFAVLATTGPLVAAAKLNSPLGAARERGRWFALSPSEHAG